MRPLVPALVLLALQALAPVPARAQATGDQARLVFTISGSWATGTNLWSVAEQPVRFPLWPGGMSEVDTVSLARRISSGIGVGVGATYFPGENFGYFAELAFLGIGYEDSCSLLSPPTNTAGSQLCDNLAEMDPSASTVTFGVGVIARTSSRGAISPYLRAGAGIAILSQSPIRMDGTAEALDGAFFTFYDDDDNTRVTPALMLGGGVTMPIGTGWQFRAEVRDNIIGIASVTGPTDSDGQVPPQETRYKSLWTVYLGVDIVLERKRGRRY
ncbi:MAG: hypothetical protein ACREMH_02855 [Gemmatimonadales bacterium]